MKIKNLKSNQDFINNGLVFNEMKNLKQVVALFGKNGSGKSRLLSLIGKEYNQKLNDLKKTEQELNELQSPKNSITKTQEQKEKIQELTNQKASILNDIEFGNGDSLIIISSKDILILSQKNMQDVDYRSGTLDLVSNPDFPTVKQKCAKFIKSICKSEIAQEYSEIKPNKSYYTLHSKIIEKNVKLYHLLQVVIKEIMNKDLDYYVDEHLTPIVSLDKRVIDINELSDGEKELLAYCTYLVLQRQDEIENKSLSLKNKIILLDEIELFLHPKAQIDLINGLRKLIGENGQIWIASHSLTILSVLDRDEIWLMDNGKITSPSIDTPSKVLSSLIGEENIDALENFISSQYEWASIQFALECLFPPQTILHKEKDNQQNQVIERLTSSKVPLKILDFGAGKGRIPQEIIRNSYLAPNIYYQPLEVKKELHSQLKELTSQLQKLSSIDSEIEREVMDSYEKLKELQYQSFYDYIFIVNVLHEIPLNKWCSILNTLLGSLKDNGHLIILEDQAIPRGENAHEYGFLIFDIEEFKILFSRKNLPKSYKHPDPKFSDRLTCVEIPKKDSIVCPASIKGSLERKKINCKIGITNLREKKEKTPKDGRFNSFLTQLYTNVDMALMNEN